MIIGGLYSFNQGREYINQSFPHLLNEVEAVIAAVDASQHKTKKSNEKTSRGKMFFNPISLNEAFTSEFFARNWEKKKEYCVYPTEFYLPSYKPRPPKKSSQQPYREMDFLKEKLGIEVQFGKYAFMVYNVCAKMTIFMKLGYIAAGIEIVPMRQFASEMSTGVSYFEQFVWDLEHRGVSNIDVPVLVIGVDAEPEEHEEMGELDLTLAEPGQQQIELLGK